MLNVDCCFPYRIRFYFLVAIKPRSYRVRGPILSAAATAPASTPALSGATASPIAPTPLTKPTVLLVRRLSFFITNFHVRCVEYFFFSFFFSVGTNALFSLLHVRLCRLVVLVFMIVVGFRGFVVVSSIPVFLFYCP